MDAGARIQMLAEDQVVASLQEMWTVCMPQVLQMDDLFGISEIFIANNELQIVQHLVTNVHFPSCLMDMQAMVVHKQVMENLGVQQN